MFRSLNDIIQKAQKKYPAFQQKIQEAKILAQWEKGVGPLIAKHTQVIGVRNAILRVIVNHAIWKSELLYRKNQILEILNFSQPQTLLKDIWFVDPYSRKNEFYTKKANH